MTNQYKRPQLTTLLALEARRLEMVKLYCEGTTYKQLAYQFNMSTSMISYHVKTFMKQYNIRTHAQLGVRYLSIIQARKNEISANV